jgi:hypothetical protein
LFFCGLFCYVLPCMEDWKTKSVYWWLQGVLPMTTHLYQPLRGVCIPLDGRSHQVSTRQSCLTDACQLRLMVLAAGSVPHPRVPATSTRVPAWLQPGGCRWGCGCPDVLIFEAGTQVQPAIFSEYGAKKRKNLKEEALLTCEQYIPLPPP